MTAIGHMYPGIMLVFMPCAEKEPMSFKVSEKVFTKHVPVRIYSKAFVRDVLGRNYRDEEKNYAFFGEYLNNHPAIVFSLLDGCEIER